MQLMSMGKQGDTHQAKLNSEFKIGVFFVTEGFKIRKPQEVDRNIHCQNPLGCIQPFYKLDTSHSLNYSIYLKQSRKKLNEVFFRNGRNLIPRYFKLYFSSNQNCQSNSDYYMFKAMPQANFITKNIWNLSLLVLIGSIPGLMEKTAVYWNKFTIIFTCS